MEQDFHVRVYREDGVFIAQCIEMDIASEGDTPDEAMAMLKEAL